MAPKLVVATQPSDPLDLIRDLAPAGFDLVIAPFNSPEYRAAMKTADFSVGFPDPGLNDAFFAEAKNLKLIQLMSAGYDRCDVAAAERARVPIANNGGANAIAVAEHAMLLMLAVSRRLIWQHTNVAAGRWRGNDPFSAGLLELHDKTLGIIGLGTIGKKVARLARAFNMRVYYYDTVRLTEDQEDALGVRFRLMHEVIRMSDIVSLHVPLVPATKHLFGARELNMMKPSALLINTCRGPVVDEAALIAHLSAGKIAGAGLDVFDQEPPPADNPLFALNNVVLTAHLAGPTADNQHTRFRNGFDNVQRVARGEAPLWVIPELRGLIAG
jgi:phosphoglycerate dehydrogenase-like enzyme